MHDALLLNADFSPVGVVAWQRAVCLVLDHKVRVVERYADRRVRAPNFEMEWPAVVHLVRYVRTAFSPPLNRMSVLARDRFACQYCGLQPRLHKRPDTRKLTLDHVVPRAAALYGRVFLPWSGKEVPMTSWQNLVTACAPCNHKKGHRSLVESGLELRAIPRRPRPQDAIRVALARIAVPSEWRDYLRLDARD